MSQSEIDVAAKGIGSGLTAALRQNTPEVTLWLNPEVLGKVKIHLTFDHGAISARFEATSQATADLIKQNTDALKSALEARGLRPESIEVSTIPDWSKQNSGTASGSGAPKDPPSQSSGNPSGGQPGGQSGSQNPGSGYPQQPHSQAWITAQSGSGSPSPSIAQVETADLASASPRLITLRTRLELDAVA